MPTIIKGDDLMMELEEAINATDKIMHKILDFHDAPGKDFDRDSLRAAASHYQKAKEAVHSVQSQLYREGYRIADVRVNSVYDE